MSDISSDCGMMCTQRDAHHLNCQQQTERHTDRLLTGATQTFGRNGKQTSTGEQLTEWTKVGTSGGQVSGVRLETERD